MRVSVCFPVAFLFSYSLVSSLSHSLSFSNNLVTEYKKEKFEVRQNASLKTIFVRINFSALFRSITRMVHCAQGLHFLSDVSYELQMLTKLFKGHGMK